MNRRQLSIALAILVLLVGTSAATSAKPRSKKKVTRVEELPYQEPTVGVAFPTYQMATCDTGCPVFDVLRGERYLTLQAEDMISPDVALAVFPWDGASGDAIRYEQHDYCTSIDEPLRLPSWTVYLWVEVLIGPCSDGTPAMATQGTVVATFSNLP